MPKFIRWIPALVMMTIIFIFSSIPGKEMPRFGVLDLSVKKGGHITVYALLALANAYALQGDKKRFWLAWLIAFLYAITDEFHQSFVPGRNAWWVDVALDSTAAGLALWVFSRFKAKLPSNPAGSKTSP